MLPILLMGALVIPARALARPDEECCGRDPGQTPAAAERRVTSFDPETGRDLLKYPPSPVADYQHMSLKLDIADMNTPRMSAVQTLAFAPVGTALSSLTLDARLLEIKSVSASRPANQKVTFAHDGARLVLSFDPPLPAGQQAEIATSYVVNDPPFGITWTPESSAWPGRPAQLHSQGQAETNSYWFPCHDFPNDRLTTELMVTVPDGYIVSSNGRLVETTRANSAATFHWLQDKPHVNYLVTLVVGKFDVETVTRSRKDRVPMPVFVPPGRGKDIKGTYGNTGRMIEVFERRTGQAYPWDQYAQLVVWNFGAGGMENTSATTMYDTAILSPEGRADGDMEGLISHELAHQWFGDLLTCKSWEHIWLNEGFATYFTNLWWEERDGKDGYYAGVMRHFDQVTGRDQADAPYQPAMASKDFATPSAAFRKPANPYPKGASVLHMLRAKLGDDVFFRALAKYVETFKFKQVETSDFRRTLEDVSGENLEQFFAQWCFRPGVPHLDIACQWKSDARELEVRIEQKQNIDGYNPAFAFNLPVWIEGRPAAAEIEVHDRVTTATFKLEAEPGFIAFDPSLSVLAKFTIDHSVGRWLAQLERGPTLASRVQAARGLVKDESSSAAQALVKIAGDPRAHESLRLACLNTLGQRGEAASLASLLRSKIESRPVREAFVEAAVEAVSRNGNGPEAVRLREFIIRAAAGDESFKVRASALQGVGLLRLPDQESLLIAATKVESQHDVVRQSALAALGSLDSPAGLVTVSPFTRPGTLSRTRPIAIDALANLAHHDRAAAAKSLSEAAADRERRTWQAAGDALVRVGDASAIPALKVVLANKRDPADRERVQAWIDALASPKK